jgi:hypothetical protein
MKRTVKKAAAMMATAFIIVSTAGCGGASGMLSKASSGVSVSSAGKASSKAASSSKASSGVSVSSAGKASSKAASSSKVSSGASSKTSSATSFPTTDAEKKKRVDALKCSDQVKNAKYEDNIVQIDSLIFDLGKGITIDDVVAKMKADTSEFKVTIYNAEAAPTTKNCTVTVESLGGKVEINGALYGTTDTRFSTTNIKSLRVSSIIAENKCESWFGGGIRADGRDADGKRLTLDYFQKLATDRGISLEVSDQRTLSNVSYTTYHLPLSFKTGDGDKTRNMHFAIHINDNTKECEMLEFV